MRNPPEIHWQVNEREYNHVYFLLNQWNRTNQKLWISYLILIHQSCKAFSEMAILGSLPIFLHLLPGKMASCLPSSTFTLLVLSSGDSPIRDMTFQLIAGSPKLLNNSGDDNQTSSIRQETTTGSLNMWVPDFNSWQLFLPTHNPLSCEWTNCLQHSI